MKNEQTPDDSGGDWNNEDVVFGTITCNNLARLCTSYVASLRLANSELKESGPLGVMKFLATVFNQQLELINSPDISASDREAIQASAALTIQAVCLGGIFAVNQIDPRQLAAIGASTIEVIRELANNVGPIGIDDEVIIQIRKGEDPLDENRIQMAVKLEPVSTISGLMSSTNLGKQIRKVVEKTLPTSPGIRPSRLEDN